MGYFRIFYYITYILNFLLRLIKRHGKAILWFICIGVFLVVCMYNPKSNAVYLGDYDYGDPNYAMYSQYDAIIVDTVKRLNNLDSSFDTIKNEILSYLKQNIVSYYVYYGTRNDLDNGRGGTEMLNGMNYNRGTIWLVVMSNDTAYWSMSPSATYSNYCGISDVDIKVYDFLNNNRNRVYRLYGNSVELYYSNRNFTITMPSQLYMFQSEYMNDYLFFDYSADELEVLYDMRSKLNQANQELQTQTDYLTEEPSSEDFDSSDLPTNSGVTDPTTSQVDNIFTTVYNVFTGNVEVSKRNINVSIPFTR